MTSVIEPYMLRSVPDQIEMVDTSIPFGMLYQPLPANYYPQVTKSFCRIVGDAIANGDGENLFNTNPEIISSRKRVLHLLRRRLAEWTFTRRHLWQDCDRDGFFLANLLSNLRTTIIQLNMLCRLPSASAGDKANVKTEGVHNAE